jgi:murein DD-endopeptidase MepM/ murein hydrolase activator NlpD
MFRSLHFAPVGIALALWIGNPAIAQSSREPLCGPPALDRAVTHVVQPGETLDTIAIAYGVIPATLIGFNPSLQTGSAAVGSTLLIPPFNGIRVSVPAGTTWQDLASQYNVRDDVLFEVNGCTMTPAATVFVPGVNWSPNGTPPIPALADLPINGYPLPNPVEVTAGYGWQIDPAIGEVVFHSGVDLAADAGTPVLAVGSGTIAFANEQGDYGNLVVINHNQGLQTRYAQLDTVTVTVGQTVSQGQEIGTVGATGRVVSPHLHFEIRTNSDLGWVARDPADYIPETSLVRR